MRVSSESPVEDRGSYLYKWDSTARRYFPHFELHKVSAKTSMSNLFSNFLTGWRDPIQYRPRVQEIDVLTYR